MRFGSLPRHLDRNSLCPFLSIPSSLRFLFNSFTLKDLCYNPPFLFESFPVLRKRLSPVFLVSLADLGFELRALCLPSTIPLEPCLHPFLL
jgi:hypothetical protein